MRRVTAQELPQVVAYLNAHAEHAMFTLHNLVDYGLDGDHPRGPRIWIGDGESPDVLCVTQENMVMPYFPHKNYAQAVAILRDLGPVAGMVGPSACVTGIAEACHLRGRPVIHDADEPQFLLHLDQLNLPEGEGGLVPIAQAPKDIVTAWMRDYQRHTINMPEHKIDDVVAQSYDRYCKSRSHVILQRGGECLAMTGVAARLPQIVLVGGVYTPPNQRSNGFARLAVALHLQQLQQQGVERATLCAANDAAATAYRAIGFERIGSGMLLLFQTPEVIHV